MPGVCDHDPDRRQNLFMWHERYQVYVFRDRDADCIGHPCRDQHPIRLGGEGLNALHYA